MNLYGFEDYDFINRLELANVKRVLIEDFSYLNLIRHTNAERNSGKQVLAEIQGMYINYHSPDLSEIIILHNNHHFEIACLRDTYAIGAGDHSQAYVSKERRFEYRKTESGKWKEVSSQGAICLLPENKGSIYLRKLTVNDCLILKSETDELQYHYMKNPDIMMEALVFINTFLNRNIMTRNLEHKIIKVNPMGFGKARVFKNFNNQQFVETESQCNAQTEAQV